MNRTILAVGAVVVTLLVVAVVTIAAAFGLFAFIIASSDHATYATEGHSYDDVEYASVVENAERREYGVEEFWVNAKRTPGIHPENVPELDERLGERYRAWSIELTYDQGPNVSTPYDDRAMSVTYESDGSRVTFHDPSRGVDEPFAVERLPDDAWTVDYLTTLFAMDEATAREYVADLRSRVADGGVDIPELRIDQSPTYREAYLRFEAEATGAVTSPTRGEGLLRVVYERDGLPVAAVTYVVPNSEITHHVGSARYVVKVDELGGTYLRIYLTPNEEIPEAEYRATFEAMFADLGLPAERVAEFEFTYTGSNW